MLLWFGLWTLLLPFLLLFIFICTATQSNCEVFRAEICLCFLLKHSGLFCCLVIIHYVIALRFGWFKIAWCFSVYLKAFSCLWVIAVKHQIRLQIRSLPRVPFGSHPGRGSVNFREEPGCASSGWEKGNLSDRCFLELLLLHLSASPQGALTAVFLFLFFSNVKASQLYPFVIPKMLWGLQWAI